MIVFITARGHGYTVKAVRDWRVMDIKIVSYDEVFAAKTFRAATYVFTDFDRLGFWELELAATVYRSLAEAGLRVLNDPAKARQRFSLLKALKDSGLNRFGVWRVEDGAWPDRYPVFLRTQSAHRGVLTGLLETPAALVQAIDGVLAAGTPRGDLMIVEYRAEPVRPGLFRKMAAYRVGDRIVPTLSVHERGWVAKDGVIGLAAQADYDWEHEAIIDNRFARALLEAFSIAEIDYGRADFGLVEGVPQIYEINTNPTIPPASKPHPFPIRTATQSHARNDFIAALRAIDTPATTRSAARHGGLLLQQQKLDRRFRGARWTP